MENKVTIKPIPRWWKFLPFVGADLAMARYPYIYLPQHIYHRWLDGKLGFHDEAMILHETMHLHRQNELGLLTYTTKYYLSKKFRLREELYAIKEQMAFLKQHAQRYDCDRKAKQFASSEYFWVTSYVEGKKILDDLWAQA